MFRGFNYIKNNIIKHSKETQSKTTILNWTDYNHINQNRYLISISFNFNLSIYLYENEQNIFLRF